MGNKADDDIDNINKLRQHLISKMLQLMPDDGLFTTVMPNIVLFKHSAPQSKTMELYPSYLKILFQSYHSGFSTRRMSEGMSATFQTHATQ